MCAYIKLHILYEENILYRKKHYIQYFISWIRYIRNIKPFNIKNYLIKIAQATRLVDIFKNCDLAAYEMIWYLI